MVFEILRTGKENAIPSEYLRQILKFKSVRELQKQIQAERLQNCKSILECYISRDLLRQVYTIMCRTERLNCAISNYAEILRRMTASQLLKAHLGMKPGEDAAVYIRAELWSRSIFAEIVRKVQYGCTKLYVHIKYHRIFRAAKNAVAEGTL